MGGDTTSVNNPAHNSRKSIIIVNSMRKGRKALLSWNRILEPSFRDDISGFRDDGHVDVNAFQRLRTHPKWFHSRPAQSERYDYIWEVLQFLSIILPRTIANLWLKRRGVATSINNPTQNRIQSMIIAEKCCNFHQHSCPEPCSSHSRKLGVFELQELHQTQTPFQGQQKVLPQLGFMLPRRNGPSEYHVFYRCKFQKCFRGLMVFLWFASATWEGSKF